MLKAVAPGKAVVSIAHNFQPDAGGIGAQTTVHSIGLLALA